MNAPRYPDTLPDIQNLNPDIPLIINNVGIKALQIRLKIPDSNQSLQTTIATCSLGVTLSSRQRGAHMSRFIEVINAWDGILEKNSLQNLLEDLCGRLCSPCAQVSLSFPLFVNKPSPSGIKADMAYQCGLEAKLEKSVFFVSVFLEIPVMTVCPCSMAICEGGAHSQRALIRMKLDLNNFFYFDNFIRLAEASASSAVYTLLKREDEKQVTEQAFARPAFVEDVARKAALLLAQEKNVKSFEVEVESMESIHNHNAFASIRSGA